MRRIRMRTCNPLVQPLSLLFVGLLLFEISFAIAPAAAPLRDKTLVVWVSPANFTQRGGSVLTIEKPGGVFDAIVLGEIAPSKWMAGSDGFKRTQQKQSDFPAETARPGTLVQVAVVYQEQQVSLFRNGVQTAT